jgi:hypothetical protein
LVEQLVQLNENLLTLIYTLKEQQQ